jgi:PPOX class probable F420-dependent enzyme
MLDLTQERDAHIDKRLRESLIIWLNSVRADGRPHSAAVWFLWDGSQILIFSQDNQKVRNLRQNPQVTLAVDDTKDGDDVVTLEGTAELVDDPTIAPTLPAYAEKYADHLQALGWTAAQMGQRYHQVIRIMPTKFHLVR